VRSLAGEQDRFSWLRWRDWVSPLVAVAVGAIIVLSRLPLQPTLGSTAPFILAWPAAMIAAFLGGFWPTVIVTALGLVVGQYALSAGGAAKLGPGGSLIFIAFGLVFATAGGMRRRALRKARADAERLAALQAQLMKVGRLNAMGEMAGGLAHELNQPLTAITSYLGAAQRLLDEEVPPRARIDDLLAKASGQALRARDIVGRIRARVSGELALEATPLSGLVRETVAVAMVGRQPELIAVRIRLDPGVDRVMADRVQLQQVLLNLLRNAIEAVEGCARREVAITSRRGAEGLVEVAVTDTGPGIAPEVAERLFQPFATSKADGMGMGLLISRSIVQGHGGDLWAEPNADGGATFRFTLRPAAREAVP